MTVGTLTVDGKRYVILPEDVYRSLRRGKPRTTEKLTRRLSAADRTDIAIARRRLSDRSERRIPWSEVKKAAGLA